MADHEDARGNRGCPPRVGVYSVSCAHTGRSYVGSSDHLLRTLAEHRAGLAEGRHANAAMQGDWDAHGEASFEFAIHEEIPAEQAQAPGACGGRQLDELRDLWVDQLGVDEGRSY